MKNKIIILLVLFFNITYGFTQNNVGIGTNTPDTNAILEMKSTDKGILIPRMSATQRNNMSPSLGITQKGLMVFDNDSTKFFYWNGYSWQTFGSGTIGPQGPPGAANIQIFGVNGTGQTDIYTTSYTVVSGLSLTITLIDSARLNIFTNGGIFPFVDLYPNQICGTVGLFINNILVPNCFQSFNTSSNIATLITNWSLSTIMSLPAGTYNFDIRAKSFSGFHEFFAGANSSYSSSSLIIQVYY